MQFGTRPMCLLCIVLIQVSWIGILRAEPIGLGNRYRSVLLASGGDTLKLTLDAARSLARRGNLVLRAARLDTAIAKGGERQARLIPFNPTIDAIAGNGGTGAEYSVTQEIEVFGKAGPRRAAAIYGVERSRATSLDVERGIVGEAERAFYGLVAALRRLEVATEVLQLNERLADAVSRQLDAGEVNRITYNLAVIELGRSRSGTLGARRDERIARLRLAQVLALPDSVAVIPQYDESAVAADSTGNPLLLARSLPDTFDTSRLIALALSLRPDVRERNAATRQAAATLVSAKRMVLPNVLLRITSEETAPGRRSLRPGLGLTLPLLNRNQGEIASRTAVLQQAEGDSRAVAAFVATEVESAIAAYLAAENQVATLRVMVLRAGRQNRELSETAYREGKIGLPEILLIRNQATSAELDYWAAWLAEREALATLAQATGQNLLPRHSGAP